MVVRRTARSVAGYTMLAVFGVAGLVWSFTGSLGNLLSGLIGIVGICSLTIAGYGLYTQRSLHQLPGSIRILLAIGTIALLLFIIIMALLMLAFRHFT